MLLHFRRRKLDQQPVLNPAFNQLKRPSVAHSRQPAFTFADFQNLFAVCRNGNVRVHRDILGTGRVICVESGFSFVRAHLGFIGQSLNQRSVFIARQYKPRTFRKIGRRGDDLPASDFSQDGGDVLRILCRQRNVMDHFSSPEQ